MLLRFSHDSGTTIYKPMRADQVQDTSTIVNNYHMTERRRPRLHPGEC